MKQRINDPESMGSHSAHTKLSDVQKNWLMRGLDQPGGKLPLFDSHGQKVSERTVRTCLEKGWAKPWFENPLNPNWIVCKLTEAGKKALRNAD